MFVVTYWEVPKSGQDTPDDWDGIKEVRIKRISEIYALIDARPAHCKMISVEHSSARKLKNGQETRFFRIIWERGKMFYKPRPDHGQITVQYPPDFDGELHVHYDEAERFFTYTFAHAKRGDAWATLVEAAKGIVAQDQRRKK